MKQPIHFGQITLFREKTVLADRREKSAMPRLDSLIRSCRLTMMASRGTRTHAIVVRGHTVPQTLRMGAAVMRTLAKDPARLTTTENVDWQALWEQSLAAAGTDDTANSWAAVYIDGKQAFGAQPPEHLTLIETVARGNPLTHELLRSLSNHVDAAPEDVDAWHDSQTSILFTEIPGAQRFAVVERSQGDTAVISVNVAQEPERPLPAPLMLDAAAAIEAINHVDMILDRPEERGGQPARARLLQRREALLRELAAFEAQTGAVYRPEKPAFLTAR